MSIILKLLFIHQSVSFSQSVSFFRQSGFFFVLGTVAFFSRPPELLRQVKRFSMKTIDSTVTKIKKRFFFLLCDYYFGLNEIEIGIANCFQVNQVAKFLK